MDYQRLLKYYLDTQSLYNEIIQPFAIEIKDSDNKIDKIIYKRIYSSVSGLVTLNLPDEKIIKYMSLQNEEMKAYLVFFELLGLPERYITELENSTADDLKGDMKRILCDWIFSRDN